MQIGLAGIFSYFNGTNKQTEVREKAASFAQSLKDAPRCDPLTAQSHPLNGRVRKFLKEQHPNCSPIEACRKEYLAFKLGVESRVFDLPINEGFRKFASKPPLERYLIEYNHSLQTHPETSEIHLLAAGQLRSWSQIKELALAPPAPKEGLPMQPWLYGPEGVQSKNMFDWTELTPYKKEDPAAWDHQYIFEFCACCEDHPRIAGDHSWLRLRTPEGDVYSVGLYRPGKGSDLMSKLDAPMSVKKGHLMQPDVSEFWPTPIRSIPVAITKEQFETIKKAIEEDKKNGAQQTFQLGENNCTLYIKKMGRLANIELPTSKLAWRPIAPLCVINAIDYLNPKLPEIARKTSEVAGALFVNSIQLTLGACSIDKNVQELKIPCKPSFRSIFDVFDLSKAWGHHPNTLGHETRNAVLAWREQERARLLADPNTTEADLARVRFGLPEAFRFKQAS